MGKVYTPTPITDVEASLADLNQNFSDIEAALDRAFDRLVDPEDSNKMGAELDLGNQDAINGSIVISDLVQTTELAADQVTIGTVRALSTLIRFRKSERYDQGDDGTAAIFLGLPGTLEVIGDASIVQGQGIVVPAGVGGLGLSISAAVYQNQTMSPSISAPFAAGFSKIIPTVQFGLSETFSDFLTIEPVLGSPSVFASAGALPTEIPAAVSGHSTPQDIYTDSATSFYCPVQEGDILYPYAWAQNVIRSATPDKTNDYEFEVVIAVWQNRVSPVAMSAEVEPIFPFAGLSNPNV